MMRIYDELQSLLLAHLPEPYRAAFAAYVRLIESVESAQAWEQATQEAAQALADLKTHTENKQ